jgi:type I restriction enzyme, S subunit
MTPSATAAGEHGRVLSSLGAVLSRIESGKSVKTLERRARDGEHGILKVSAVTWGQFDPDENKAILPDYVPGDCPRPARGDLLISRANTVNLVGAVVLVEDDHPDLLLSDKILRLVPDATRADSRYLLYALRAPSTRRHFESSAGGTSGSMQNITQGDIRSTPLYLPPLPEQRRIAAILDKADAVRRKRREAIGLTEELLRAAFLEMFGDPVTNPKGWPSRRIGDVARVTTGNTPPRERTDYFGDNVEWIKSDNINTPSHYLTRAAEGLSTQGRRVGRAAPAGSVLMTCIAGSPECIGNVAIADREVAFNQQINAITPDDDIDHGFLYVLLLVGKRLIQAASTNSMKGMVSKGKLEDVVVPLPPLPKQRRFGEYFARSCQTVNKMREAEAQGDALFSSLLHRAFRGEV